MILIKLQYNEICRFLVAGIYQFWFLHIHCFKQWKVDKIGYTVIAIGC